MESEIRISHREGSDWTVVEVHGEADVYTARQFRDHLVDRMEEGHYRFIIDLRDVRFMDSTGLGAIASVRKRLHAHDGEMRLVITDQNMRWLFHQDGPARHHPDLRVRRRGEASSVGQR
ncbi:STAS domain-containing protein [Streptomyces sp. NPDC003996]